MSVGRTTELLGFSVPPAVAREMERLAKEEGRTKSELFREMFRVYRRYRELRELEEDRWVARIIEEAQAEQVKMPMTAGEIVAASEELARAGASRARKLGIKTDLESVNRLLHEHRKG